MVTNTSCEPALYQEAYSEYLLSVDEAQVKHIQRELNQLSSLGNFDIKKIIVDGVLGEGTRKALYQYCLGLQEISTENFIISLLKEFDLQQRLVTRDSHSINSYVPTVVEPTTDEVEGKSDNIELNKDEGRLAENDDNPPSTWYMLTKERLESVVEAAKKTGDKSVDDAGDEKSEHVVDEENNNKIMPLPSDESLLKLTSVFDIPYLNRAKFMSSVTSKTGITHAAYPEFSAALAEGAKNSVSPRLESIMIEDNGCGCVRSFSDTIYGFYPYWRSTASEEITPIIDYSIVNRIAYYALTLDEHGEINVPLHWSSNGKLGNFINKAHRHKTAVDLVVYSSHWPQWTESAMQASLTSIYNKMALEIEYSQSGVMAYVPFLNTTLASPDGVTLYFDRYSDKPESRYKIIEFISLLHERLEGLERDLKINILLDIESSALNSELALFSDIKNLLVSDNSGADAYVDSLLVFIAEPTTKTKKLLRSKIEDEFSGSQRMAVLRKVIPVITPYGHENDTRGAYTQFSDDLVYFKNNFSGVGLWPLPLASDKDAAMVSQWLIDTYAGQDINGVLNAISARYPALCEFACPNRWVFRLVIDLLLLLALGYGVLTLFSRRLRRFYSRNSLYFMFYILLMASVFLVSLMCDPFWKQKRDMMLLGALLVSAAIFMVRKYSQAKQGPLP